MEGSGEKPGGECGKFLQPVINHHLAATETDAPEEDIETIYDEVGVGVGEL